MANPGCAGVARGLRGVARGCAGVARGLRGVARGCAGGCAGVDGALEIAPTDSENTGTLSEKSRPV